MARISKPGLDYFPLDVNFLQDRKVRRISCRHHAAGIAALTSLLCLIYKEKGYYISWNKDTLFDIADLIKDAVILPQAFISAMRGDDEQGFREACIESLVQAEALDFMIDTVKAIALDIGRQAQ